MRVALFLLMLSLLFGYWAIDKLWKLAIAFAVVSALLFFLAGHPTAWAIAHLNAEYRRIALVGMSILALVACLDLIYAQYRERRTLRIKVPK